MSEAVWMGGDLHRNRSGQVRPFAILPDAATKPRLPQTVRVLVLLLIAQALACHAAALALELCPALFAPPLTEWLACVFAQAQILLGVVVLAIILHRHCRWLWLADFAAIYGFALLAETFGVTSGLLFGSYRFTDLLGYKWFGLVPLLIPVAWFNIAVPSFVVASLAIPSRAGRVVGGAALMLAWDLCADPVMGHRFLFWVWRDDGWYYGIPLSNFASWFLMGLLISTWLERRSWSHVNKESGHPFLVHYGASLFMVLGLALIYRMNMAVLICLALLIAVQSGRRIGWAQR